MKLIDCFHRKKSKILLLYGYGLPIMGSLIVGVTPRLLGYQYRYIAEYFSGNIELVFALLAVVGAIIFPFQSSIINENNPHVLTILNETKVRAVFVKASVFQAILILCLTLLMFVLSMTHSLSEFIGFLQIFSFSLIIFESMALVSNGRAYNEIREKIITSINNAKVK